MLLLPAIEAGTQTCVWYMAFRVNYSRDLFQQGNCGVSLHAPFSLILLRQGFAHNCLSERDHYEGDANWLIVIADRF
jgi:hypothetical protein